MMRVFSQFLLTLSQHMSPKCSKIFSFPNTPHSSSSDTLDDLTHLWNLDNPTQAPLIPYFPFQNIIPLLLPFIFLFVLLCHLIVLIVHEFLPIPSSLGPFSGSFFLSMSLLFFSSHFSLLFLSVVCLLWSDFHLLHMSKDALLKVHNDVTTVKAKLSKFCST